MYRLDRTQITARRACDNMECGVIRDKKEFRCCSACKSTYYCSNDCQRHDWGEGHRQECDRLRSNRFRDPWDLGVRNKAYI
ncbi:hypothetical protein B0H19DRAFT_1111184 [Mycena capillaripes]|nr:hypothetical protein B0H19DRAFT_1111184 [Mycena capillaripes]